MVQFLSINFFFLGFLQFLLGFSKVPIIFVSPHSSSVQSEYPFAAFMIQRVQKQRKKEKTGLQTRKHKHKIIIIMISLLPSYAVSIFCSSELFLSLLLSLLASKCFILYIPLTISLQPPIE